MEKSTSEKIELIRKEVINAYKALQAGDANEMAKSASTLAMQNFSLGSDIADLQFESESLYATHKHHLAQSFAENKDAGYTDKLSDSNARLKWKEMEEDYIAKSREYRLAKNAHDDCNSLIDVLRTNISIKKQELNKLGG